MSFCYKCGKQIDGNESFCMNCGAPVNISQSNAGGYAPEVPQFQQNEAVVQNAMPRIHCPAVLTDGEEIIKEYQVTKGLFLPLTGYLTVTNKRLLFHAKSIFSNLMQETPISDVGTIHQSSGYYFSIKTAIVGLIFVALSQFISAFFMNFINSSFFDNSSSDDLFSTLKIVFIVFGVFFLFLSIKPTNRFIIMTGKASGNGINCGDTKNNGLAFYTLGARRGKDFGKMMVELGAMVSDLQTLGDNAIAKWQVK